MRVRRRRASDCSVPLFPYRTPHVNSVVILDRLHFRSSLPYSRQGELDPSGELHPDVTPASVGCLPIGAASANRDDWNSAQSM
jgi:hypothetical protein